MSIHLFKLSENNAASRSIEVLSKAKDLQIKGKTRDAVDVLETAILKFHNSLNSRSSTFTIPMRIMLDNILSDEKNLTLADTLRHSDEDAPNGINTVSVRNLRCLISNDPLHEDVDKWKTRLAGLLEVNAKIYRAVKDVVKVYSHLKEAAEMLEGIDPPKALKLAREAKSDMEIYHTRIVEGLATANTPNSIDALTSEKRILERELDNIQNLIRRLPSQSS